MSGWHSLSGLLYSKPTGPFSRFKSKKPQYYVFEESKCQLHFYKDKQDAAQKDKEPMGTINVRGGSITLHFDEPNSFVINSEGKEFILQAENHESMMIWLLALQANRDAYASKELKPENSRMIKQLALAHKRRFSDNSDSHYGSRESAPDVSSFRGSSSLGALPGRGATGGGRRVTRINTLDAGSLMTRSAIEEEDEITKDWVDCEFLPEVTGAGCCATASCPQQHQQPGFDASDHSGSNGLTPAVRRPQEAASSSLSSRFGLSLSQSFTSGLARPSRGGLEDAEDSGGSDAEAFNYDTLVDESPKRRAAYAGAPAGANKPRSEDSGIDGSSKDARNPLSSQSDDSLLDPTNRVHDLEQELM